jgi:hypothetical protein
MFISRILLFAMLLVSMGLTSENVSAQTKRQTRRLERIEGKAEIERKKALIKQREEKVKELKSENWQTSGSRTLEVMLIDHYKLYDGLKEYPSEISNCKSINLCYRAALTTAQNYYAQQMNNMVEGEYSELLTKLGASKEDTDNFHAVYTGSISAEMGRLLTESYMVKREHNDGYDIRVIYVIDEEKAFNSALDALERSLKENAIVSKNVKEANQMINQIRTDRAKAKAEAEATKAKAEQQLKEIKR